jgi:hypothetical protein
MSKAISISSKRHDWKSLYLAALLDVNETRIQERIANAEAAIMQREAELRQLTGDHIEEQQNLDDAMYALGALRKTSELNRSMSTRMGEWEPTGT